MKKIIVLLVFVLFIVFIPKTDAARIVCSSSNMSKMRSKAYKVTANYEFVNENGDRYFLIRITNVESGIEVRVDGHIFKDDTGKGQVFEFKKYSNELTSVQIEMYAGYGQACVGELLYTKKLDLPKYNFYSEKPECIEYEEFALCNKWYQGNIRDDYEFKTKLQEYIDSLNPKEDKEEIEDNKSFFQKIIDFYVDHIVYTGLITVAVLGVLVYFIVKKLINKKNRVKIDFKG